MVKFSSAKFDKLVILKGIVKQKPTGVESGPSRPVSAEFTLVKDEPSKSVNVALCIS